MGGPVSAPAETLPWKLKNPAAADIAPDWLQPYCTQFLLNISAASSG
jgi:hypothetical protein